MSVLPSPIRFHPADPAAERRRRLLLEQSDRLLDRLEELRLAGRHLLPPALAEAVHRLQLRLGQPAARPRTLRAAHQLVFAAQQRLMAANPRHPRPRPHLGRAQGTARVAPLAGGATWKFLTLPAPAPGRPGAEWRELVEATVERALDRWALAQAQAVAAARARRGVGPALARARAAWSNYWELRCEAEALLGASDRPTPAVGGAWRATPCPPGRWPAAPHPRPPRPRSSPPPRPPAPTGAGDAPPPRTDPAGLPAHPATLESGRWDRTRGPRAGGWASPAGDGATGSGRRCPSAELGRPGLPRPALAGGLRPPGDPARGTTGPPRHPPGPGSGRDLDLGAHRPTHAAAGRGRDPGLAPDRQAGGAPRPAG